MSSIPSITATQSSNTDVVMQDAFSGDRKVKDVVQKKLGVSTGAIAKPKTIYKREKPQVHPPAVQSSQADAAPIVLPAASSPVLVRAVRPQSQVPQSVGLNIRDEEDGDLLGRFGRLGV